jgi:hypothetical protein
VSFINDVNEAVERAEIIKKFDDDTKTGQSMVSNEDGDELQQALDSICACGQKGCILNTEPTT